MGPWSPREMPRGGDASWGSAPLGDGKTVNHDLCQENLDVRRKLATEIEAVRVDGRAEIDKLRQEIIEQRDRAAILDVLRIEAEIKETEAQMARAVYQLQRQFNSTHVSLSERPPLSPSPETVLTN